MDFPKTRFIIRLKRDITHSKETIEKLLDEFARVAGVYRNEITDLVVRSGCTIIEGYMSRAAIERLYDYYEYLKEDEADTDELKQLQSIIKQFEIEVLIDDPASNDNCKFEPPHRNKKVYIFLSMDGVGKKKKRLVTSQVI